MVERSKALQIYFKPGLAEDDLMLRVWHAARRRSRPQEIFRSMLREGLVQLVANGKLDESIIEECGLDAIVERRRQRTTKHSDRPAPAPQPPAHGYGYPSYPPYAPAPVAPVYPEPPHHYAPQRPAPQQPHHYEEIRPSPPPVERLRQETVEAVVVKPEPRAETSNDREIPREAPATADGTKPQRKLGKLM